MQIKTTMKYHLSPANKVQEKDLSHTSSKGDELSITKEVPDHLGGGKWGKPYVQEREIPQQEVHREGVQVGVRNHSDHDDEVTQHKSHIDPREENKE